MKKWIHIWYSWGDQEEPVEVPDGVDPWEYMKKLAIDEADTYQEEHAYGCGIWMHPDDNEIELKYFHEGSYCYYLVTNSNEVTAFE